MKELKTKTTLSLLTAILAVTAIIGYFNYKTEPKNNILKNIEKFSGFQPGTKIQILYKIDDINIDEKKILIQSFDDLIISTPNDQKFSKISYIIQTAEDDFIDIFAQKTATKTIVTITGLRYQEAVSLNDSKRKVPVDWAGRITLEDLKSKNNEGFCLTIHQNSQIICHNQKIGTSS